MCECARTVTVHAAFSSSVVLDVPLMAVAVIAASPAPTAVTFPFWSTAATLVSLVIHVTVLYVALSGVTAAVSVSVSLLSTIRVMEVLSRNTSVTVIIALTFSFEDELEERADQEESLSLS